MKKLYVIYIDFFEHFVLYDKEPVWDEDYQCWSRPPDAEIAERWCSQQAMRVFPKLRKDSKEFLEIPIPKGTVWGPA